MIPGVSRSGATIVGALLLGADKRSAAEFSFFLSMPTMAGAFAYDLFKNRDILSLQDGAVIAVGFVAAFLSAVVVVSRLLDFVSRRGYAVFAWWRIAVGLATLTALALTCRRRHRSQFGPNSCRPYGMSAPQRGAFFGFGSA